MLQYQKEKFEKESLCGSSIVTSRTSLQEENESDFSSISTNTSTPINEELVIKRLKMNNDEYNKKMELGKIIAKAIKDGEIAASIRSSRISLQEETESDFSSISTYTSTPIN